MRPNPNPRPKEIRNREGYYRAEEKGTQYSKKERAERFKEPKSDRTVVEAASYEATKGAELRTLRVRLVASATGCVVSEDIIGPNRVRIIRFVKRVFRKKEEH